VERRSQQLIAVATEAQGRIDDAMASMTASEIKGSKFDQAGLRNGLEIVEGYVRAGEFGVAFDHLRYMVKETDIPLSSTSVRFLEETAVALGLMR
jgi:hypothetical protein